MQAANIVDGSLARFIIIPTADDYPEEVEGRGIRTAPAGLIEQLRLLADGGGHAPIGNLAGLGAGLCTSIEPMTVPMTPAARDAFRDLGGEITRQLREVRGTSYTAILAQVAENAAKVALVCAVGRDPVVPAIDLAEADWAIGFVRHLRSAPCARSSATSQTTTPSATSRRRGVRSVADRLR